jgi:ATP-dependent DNA helicase RecQ
MIETTGKILADVFGYRKFRPLQEEIIQNILGQKDTLVIMPTGGGKSLCYQIPALIFEGLTIVVSPLISLMKDQVGQLSELGVKAAVLNSSLSSEEYRENVARVLRNEAKLLYLAPETLLLRKTLELLSSQRVDCLVIDEAHCISEWGHDFRPEYRQLIEGRKYFPDAVCVALTATATPRVRQDIVNCLSLKTSNEFIASFNRENLFLQIVPKADPVRQTKEFIRKFPDQSGIVYCSTRQQVDDMAKILTDEGFSVKPYHAGLPDAARHLHQELFIRDDIQIIVATIAFGMGINKSNIRFVLHYDLPKNIESYYQQIGRAGRDGLNAHCLLLFGYGDIGKIKYFLRQMEDKEQRTAQIQLDALIGLAESSQCRRIPLLKYFGEDYSKSRCEMCDNCLSGEQNLVDLTAAAQKFLSCVKYTGERFGAVHIIDVLRGSGAQKVIKFNHHRLPAYGTGKEYSKKQWLYLARQFLQKELLSQDPEFGSLKLTPKAMEVLDGDGVVMGTLESEKSVSGGSDVSESAHDRALFELLRQKRKELADKVNVPPYVIFPDKTLVKMATFFPQSRDSLSQLHGVGSIKLDKYGDAFLEILHQYRQTHQNKGEERP